MDRIRDIRFPDLILDKQDRSDKYGYHWVETTYKDRRTQNCVLLKEKDDVGYYLPLNPPYEICREYNFPENKNSCFIINSSEQEYKALKGFLPMDVFMPSLEWCNNISAEEWHHAFMVLVDKFPDMINNIAGFSFMVGSDNPLYKGYYLICHPFVNMVRRDNGDISYKGERTWAVKETHNIKIDGEYTNHTGNVYFHKKEYMEDWFGGCLLPVILVK